MLIHVQVVQIDERTPERRCKSLTEMRLACASHADEDHRRVGVHHFTSLLLGRNDGMIPTKISRPTLPP